jgi:predicted CXXCH cytochrome family protein
MVRFLFLAIVVGAAASQGAGSEACAPCHRAIVESYRRTPMARSSGKVGRDSAIETFARSSFTHDVSGFRYRVTPYAVEFERNGRLHGKKDLAWFIGSGATARSYLVQAAGFLFEAPVAYYTREAKWELAPAYDRYAYPYLTRPIAPGCLGCHASFLNATPGTLNGYGDPPFAEGGVACERCHGSGDAHIAAANGRAIVNPAKLPPDRRDSVCAQCHLSGEVRVMRSGRDWQSYRPGDRLADSMTVFVRDAAAGMTVTSHVENLAQSACKRQSGDRMWCGTCHDPHSVPAASERVFWFRTKCLSCHETHGCTESLAVRRRNGDDCAGCHMPKGAVTDAQHVVFTDHSIPRRPRRPAAAPTGSARLVPFGDPASARDTAMAYAIAAGRLGIDASRVRPLVEAAHAAAPDDVEVMVSLAEIYRNSGDGAKAFPLYRRAIELDPAQLTAPVGLGGIFFERGEYREAIALWQDALRKNPGLVLTATNLAMAQWRAGDPKAAEATLRKVIDLSPGFQIAVDLLDRLKQPQAK